jgi:hypothetical protein
MSRWKQRTSGDHSSIAGGDQYIGMAAADLLSLLIHKERKIWRLRWWVFFLSVVCVSLLFWALWLRSDLAPGLKQAPPSPRASSNPPETPLDCAHGKWITQLGSEKPAADKQANAQLVADAMSKVKKRAKEHDVTELHVYYTWIDDDQCEAISDNNPGGVHLFWSGPYPNGTAAKQICNRLGYTKEKDRGRCYARTIDKDRKGKNRIAPDGTPW